MLVFIAGLSLLMREGIVSSSGIFVQVLGGGGVVIIR